MAKQRAKKWTPVFRENAAKTKKPSVDCDSAELQLALGRRAVEVIGLGAVDLHRDDIADA